MEMIIGITGTTGSGKDTIAEELTKRGFQHFTGSDIIKEELLHDNIPLKRDNFRRKAIELREKAHDPGVLVHKMLKKSKGKSCVISSLRFTGDLNVLKQQKNFTLISVDAPIDERYQRNQKRARGDETKTFKEFYNQEQLEFSGENGNNNLLEVMKQADYKIINDKSLEEFKKQITRTIDLILHK